MNDSSVWQVLSIQDFLNRANWQGRPQSQPELPTQESTAQNSMAQSGLQTLKQSEVAPIGQSFWKQQTVQDFFGRSNWKGVLPSLTGKEQGAPQSITFSLDLPVSEFFKYFAWEGRPNIAALPCLESSAKGDSTPSDDFNLTDLSDLF